MTPIVYVATSAGMFSSNEGGGSWSAANTGLASTSMTALVLNPQSPATLIAGTSTHGVFRTDNGAASWSAANSGLSATVINAVAVNPGNASIAFAGSQGTGL